MAASVPRESPTIDWNFIRENKEKHEQIKWKGGSHITAAHSLQSLKCGCQWLQMDCGTSIVLNRFCGICNFPEDVMDLKKKFYVEAESVSMLTAEEVNEWR